MKSFRCHQQQQQHRYQQRYTAKQCIITKHKLLLAVLLLSLVLTFNGHAMWPASVLVMAQPYRDLYNAKCTDTQTGRELYVGEAFTRPGLCVRVQCLGTLQLWEDNCGVPELKGNCTSIATKYPFRDHPHCCPQYECRTYAMEATGKTEEVRTYDHYGILRKTIIERVFVMDGINGTLPANIEKMQFEI